MPRPTEDNVMETRKALLDEWSKCHKEWRTWETYYNKKHTIRYAAPAEPRKLSVARNKIQSMIDTLVTYNPIVRRKPQAEGREAQERADKLEKWATGLLRKVASRAFVIPPFRAGAEHLTLLGYANGVTRWNDAAWPEKPPRGQGTGYTKRVEEWEKRRKAAFPFTIEFPHPGRILMPPMERQPSLAIETSTAYAYQVKRMLEDDPDGNNVVSDLSAKDFDLLEVVVSMDDEWQGMFVNGREAFVRNNGFGFVPYTQGYAGFGHEQMPDYPSSGGAGDPGYMSSGAKPEDLAIGLLTPVLDSIVSLDEFSTALLAIALRAAYKHVVTTEDAEELAKQFEQAGLAGIIQITQQGGMVDWEKDPQMGPWIFQVAQMFRADIDQGTFVGEISGQRSPGVETATQHAMILGSARMRFMTPMLQLNFMAQEHVGFAARMMAVRGEKVTIDGITVSGDEFEGVYDFEVDFMAKDEGQQLREREAGMREYQSGLVDFITYQQESAGREDAAGIRRRLLLDKALPEVLPTVIEAVDLAFRNKHQMTPKMQQGQPGQPQEPFVPQPGGAEQAQTGYQGQTNIPGQGIGRV